jgi:hypothetical protein
LHLIELKSTLLKTAGNKGLSPSGASRNLIVNLEMREL